MNILDYSDLITFLISTGSVVGVCVCVWCGGMRPESVALGWGQRA